MAVLIQLRRGTAAAWTTANPILAQGEPGYETDTHKEKIGDGVTAWNALAYKSSGGTFPIITIAARPFELRKTVNLDDASKATTLEVNDIVLGTPAAGQWGAYRYEGGDNTDFDNNYIAIAGI